MDDAGAAQGEACNALLAERPALASSICGRLAVSDRQPASPHEVVAAYLTEHPALLGHLESLGRHRALGGAGALNDDLLGHLEMLSEQLFGQPALA